MIMNFNDSYSHVFWDDNEQLRSTKFQDIFFSKNGIEEARHVFMEGNSIPWNFKSGFHIGELGFGTGLNLFLALKLWREWNTSQEVLRFTSFEINPLPGMVIRKALLEFPEIKHILEEFLPHWEKGETKIKLSNLDFELIVGDARETIILFNQKVDCWFLDGFSPKTNPEMWEGKLFRRLADRTKPGGTVATFSSADMVQNNLSQAGFTIERIQGFGKKKHMVRGKLANG